MSWESWHRQLIRIYISVSFPLNSQIPFYFLPADVVSRERVLPPLAHWYPLPEPQAAGRCSKWRSPWGRIVCKAKSPKGTPPCPLLSSEGRVSRTSPEPRQDGAVRPLGTRAGQGAQKKHELKTVGLLHSGHCLGTELQQGAR